MTDTTEKQPLLLFSASVPRPAPKAEAIDPVTYEALLNKLGWSAKDSFASVNQTDAPEMVVLPKYFHIQNDRGHYITTWVYEKGSVFYPVGPVFTETPSDRSIFTLEPSGDFYRVKPELAKARNVFWDEALSLEGIWKITSRDTKGALFSITPTQDNSHIYLKVGNKWLNYDSNAYWGLLSLELRQSISPSSLFKISAAAVQYSITDVQYFLNDAEILKQPPLIAHQANVSNPTNMSVDQSFSYSYTHSKVGTWNDTAGVSVGVSTTFKAGVPFIAEGGITIDVTATYQHSWGGSESETETVTQATTVKVPPKTSGKIVVVVHKSKLNIKFTYKIKALWLNGETTEETKNGMYENVDSYKVDVNLTEM